jgi:hypothetical protein
MWSQTVLKKNKKGIYPFNSIKNYFCVHVCY